VPKRGAKAPAPLVIPIGDGRALLITRAGVETVPWPDWQGTRKWIPTARGERVKRVA
jgi:hypothetical protein